MGKIMKTLENCLRSFFWGAGLFFICAAMASCEERRQGIDYRFNEKNEGWYFLLYEQEGAKELQIVQNRIQVEYQKGERLVVTSSSPDFGWAQDKFYLHGKEVRSSSLGGVHPSRFVKIKEAGKTLKYKEFYLGDFKNIDRYGDPDKILEKLLAEQKQKKSHDLSEVSPRIKTSGSVRIGFLSRITMFLDKPGRQQFGTNCVATSVFASLESVSALQHIEPEWR